MCLKHGFWCRTLHMFCERDGHTVNIVKLKDAWLAINITGHGTKGRVLVDKPLTDPNATAPALRCVLNGKRPGCDSRTTKNSKVSCRALRRPVAVLTLLRRLKKTHLVG